LRQVSGFIGPLSGRRPARSLIGVQVGRHRGDFALGWPARSSGLSSTVATRDLHVAPPRPRRLHHHTVKGRKTLRRAVSCVPRAGIPSGGSATQHRARQMGEPLRQPLCVRCRRQACHDVEGSRCLLTIAAAYLPPACPRVRGDVGNTERHNSGALRLLSI